VPSKSKSDLKAKFTDQRSLSTFHEK